MGKQKMRRILAALVLALAVSCTGSAVPAAGVVRRSDVVSPDATFQIVAGTNGFGLFGDSIMAVTASELAQMANRHGVNAAANAVGGRTTSAMADVLADYAERGLLPPRLMVISGANDVYAASASGFEAQVERTLTIMGDRAVYWSTVYVEHWQLDGNRRVRDAHDSGLMNAVLARAAARHPNLRLVEWSGFLRGVAGSSTPPCCPGVVTFPRPVDRLSDGVHTNESGDAAMAALFEQKITW